jgi:hypothetical protein
MLQQEMAVDTSINLGGGGEKTYQIPKSNLYQRTTKMNKEEEWYILQNKVYTHYAFKGVA